MRRCCARDDPTATTEIRLDELSFDASRALVEHELGQWVDDDFVSCCRTEAGGNPLLLLNLVRARTATTSRGSPHRRCCRPSTSACAASPRTPPDALHALHALAVLGGEVTLPRVAELIGTEPGELAGTIAALHRMGLLSAEGSLVHPLVRNTLREELTITESERRVAALAAEGKMNREIAAALFVQLRTVEIHLTKVCRKLGIDGHDQLAPVWRLAG